MVAAWLLAGCGGPELSQQEELGTQESAAVVGTTSVCVTKANTTTTVRVDGASILGSSNTDNSDSVVVSSGATQDPPRGQQYAFVESGGFFYDGGGGAHGIFVAAGGKAELNGGGGHRIRVKANSTFVCTSLGGDVTIYYEPGAILQNCAGKATLVQQAVTDTFRRCSSTTAANQVYPRLNFTHSRSGSVLTASNTTTGNYSNLKWSVKVMKYSYPNTVTTLFTSTTPSGFSYTLPSTFDTSYPSASYYRLVVLEVTDPFGLSISHQSTF